MGADELTVLTAQVIDGWPFSGNLATMAIVGVMETLSSGNWSLGK